MDDKERRVKVFSIDRDVLIDVLNGLTKWEYLALPTTEEIPDGAKVVECNSNWSRRSIDLLVEHPSYEPVRPGNQAPNAEVHLERTVLVRKKLSDTHELAEK